MNSVRPGKRRRIVVQYMAPKMTSRSNRAAELLRHVVDGVCRVVVLAHLSEKNNTQQLALRSAAAAVGGGREIHVAAGDRPLTPIVV